MKSKHTPGPWKLDRGIGRLGINKIFVDDCRTVADVFPAGLGPKTTDEAEANMRIILSAPEMLAALEECVKAINDEIGSAGEDEVKENPILKHHAQVAKRAEAIIRKAKGQ